MSKRVLFVLLLFANLAFFGWAELIDVPPEPPASDSISQLPQLKLLSEVRGGAAAHGASSAGAAPAKGASATTGAVPPAAAGASTGVDASSTGPAAAAPAGAASDPAAPVGRSTSASTSSGSASSGAAPNGGASSDAVSPKLVPPGARASSGSADAASAVPASELTAPASGREPATASTRQRCVTVGPFTDPGRAREASDLLQQRGFSPRLREAPSGPPAGYWVFIGGLRTTADEARIVRRLERNGISDAKAMPASVAGHTVSVGLFSAREGAERRARAVRRLGLDPEIEARPPPMSNWVDVSLDSSTQALPTVGLLALKEDGSRLEIKECAAPGSEGAPPEQDAREKSGSKRSTPASKPPAATPSFIPQIPEPLTAAGRPRPG